MTANEAAAPASGTGEARGPLLVVLLLALDAVVLGAWLDWLVAAVITDARPLPWGAAVAIGALAYGVGAWLIGSGLGLGAARLIGLGAAALTLGVLARLLLYPGAPLMDLAWLGALLSDSGRMLAGSVTGPGVLVLTWLYMWWRGSELAAEVRRRVAPRSVAVNVVSLAALALLSRIVFPIALTGAVSLAFPLALVALALARLEDVAEASGGMRAVADRGWWSILAGAIGLCGALGLLLASPFAGALARAVATRLRPVTDLVLGGLLLGLGVIFWLVSLVLTPLLEAIVNLVLRGRGKPQVPQRQELKQLIDQLQAGVAALPPWVLLAVRGLVALVLMAVVAGWLAGVLRRYNDGRRAPEGATLTSELDMRRAAADLAEAARAALRSARRALARLTAGTDVRGIYRKLLRFEAERGRAKPAAQTPYEYAPTPAEDLPQAAPEVGALTDAYVRARYGGETIAADELARLRADWERILRAGKR